MKKISLALALAAVLTTTTAAPTFAGVLVSDIAEQAQCNQEQTGVLVSNFASPGVLVSNFASPGVLVSNLTGVLVSNLTGVLVSNIADCPTEQTGVLVSN